MKRKVKTPQADSFSITEARRIALAAQGFDRPRPRGAVTAKHLAEVIRRLGLMQIDFVNVLVPAHFLVPFSRLGPYERASLHRVIYESGDFTEQWAHEASILPIDAWPLLRYRMESRKLRPWPIAAYLKQHPNYAREALDAIRTRGPLIANDLPKPNGAPKRIGDAWSRTVPRAVLEAHFTRGRLAVTNRLPGFMRQFDLAVRTIPAEHYQRQYSDHEAQRELLRRSARACGIATARDLSDYYRIKPVEARPRIAELVEAGELREVRVEGWKEAAYLHRDAKLPRRIEAAALLSPFDPVVWFRPRAARLFDFDYRIEIYTPEAKRKYGYYVLPFLLNELLVARLDLKADRAARTLLVQAAHREPGVKSPSVVAALHDELRSVADWLGLDSINVNRRGNLARALSTAIRS